MYELAAQGLQRADVTSAGIYIATEGQTTMTGGATTTAAGGPTETTGATGTTGAAGQEAEMVIDLLAGQSGGVTTTAAGGASTVIASGTLSEENFVGDWSGRSVTEIVTLLTDLVGGQNTIWVQIGTMQNPEGELRGYVDVSTLIQQLFSGVGGTPATGGSTETTGGTGTTGALPTTSSS
jgi:hypothetical protein